MILPEKPPIEEVLKHYGVDHNKGNPGSGRYRWGSGEDPYQHPKDFKTRVEQLRAKNEPYTDVNGKWGPPGKTYVGDTAVAHQMGLSSTEFRLRYTAAKNEEKTQEYMRVKKLLDEGYGPTEIARMLGYKNESSVRSIASDESQKNRMLARETADFLKEIIDERGIIDIGPGQENYLGIPRKRFDDAVFLLEQEGYKTSGGGYKNPTDLAGEHNINLNVLGPKDMLPKDIYDPNKINFMTMKDYNKFREDHELPTLNDFIEGNDGKIDIPRFEYPASLDSKRIMIRYAENGGEDRDGLIEIRRGLPDLDLQGSTYCQTRIMVDNDHYLKGMALYSPESDSWPKGIDIVFNTNKTSDVPKMEVLKECKKDDNGNIDRDNPFGSNIKEIKDGGQYYYTDKNGKQQLGLINKTRAEGDWSEWQDKVPAQFLSKQNPQLAERQLNLAVNDKKAELNDILALENPTLRRKLLDTFANDCDSAAVHLQAAALPRQKHQVILPMNSMREDEVYAPGYRPGETVALIRYPHAGTFEIPILKVNNNNPEAKKWLGSTEDCVAINSKVAQRLSGADFDGDTVMVIPTNNRVKITSTPVLPGLKNEDGSYFDPKQSYGTKKVIDIVNGKEVAHYYNRAGKEIKPMSEEYKQKQMGIVSNLINDMNIKGANPDEMAKAVKHSMVVIDAAKHKLDYKQSEIDNDIKKLKERYQSYVDEDGKAHAGGASTLISRAKNEKDVVKRQGQPRINKKGNYDYDPSKPEGALIFKESDQKYGVQVQIKETVVDPKTGKEKVKSKWVWANDATPKYERDEAKNNDISKVQSKIKNGSYFYYDTVNGKRQRVTVTNEPTKISTRMTKSTQMAETSDARTLISDYNAPIERIYASYANSMKALANQARKTLIYTKGVNYSPNAAKTYAKEVEQLKASIDICEKNAPRERQAIVLATSRINAKKELNPDLKNDKRQLKKISQRELTKARDEVGAQRHTIDISPRQWEAIQAGALHKTTLEKVFDHADLDILREYATPSNSKVISDAKKARIRSMKASGYTNGEIGEALGISASSVSKVINDAA